jgi:DNA-binding Lrp family transcriptional regulator
MLWLLNQSDGSKSLVDIAVRAGLSFEPVQEAASALVEAGLLRSAAAPPSLRKPRASSLRGDKAAKKKSKRTGLSRRRGRAADRGKGVPT